MECEDTKQPAVLKACERRQCREEQVVQAQETGKQGLQTSLSKFSAVHHGTEDLSSGSCAHSQAPRHDSTSVIPLLGGERAEPDGSPRLTCQPAKSVRARFNETTAQKTKLTARSHAHV